MSSAATKPIEPVMACLAFGSNLGDRAGHIHSAIGSLRACAGIEVVKVSSLHETDPVGTHDQGKYINAAAMLRTTMSPRELLNECLRIEIAHGRTRTKNSRWGPRTLDIDLLLYGEQIIDDMGPPRLCVPHPRLAGRRFVLEPLAEIAANLIHPVLNRRISDLRNALRSEEYQHPRPCF